MALVLYGVSAILVVTSLSGFCVIYKIFDTSTLRVQFKHKKTNLIAIFVLLVLLLIIFAGGIYYSNNITKKVFLQDFNSMNGYYKSVLSYTGQGNRADSISNYDLFFEEFSKFSKKYSDYKPFVIKFDKDFDFDLNSISYATIGSQYDIYSGNLSVAHARLEVIRSIFQGMLKRNSLSLIDVYLVDFHDIINKLIYSANCKNSLEVIALYKQADEKLKFVEQDLNSADVKYIRLALDSLYKSALDNKTSELPEKASILKASFIHAYLKG
jgi:hypothetical protein